MAIDYIIGALQLLSAAVNVLALGSFWITPGLRTTANRFVINLLIVNIVGCLALTPALWLHGGLSPTVYSETQPIYDNEENTFTTIASPSLPTPQIDSTVKANVFVEIFATKQIFVQNDDVEIIADIHEDEHKIQTNHTTNSQRVEPKRNHTTTKPTNKTWSPTKNVQYSDCTRLFLLDLVAALGMFISYHHCLYTFLSLLFELFLKTNPGLSHTLYVMKNYSCLLSRIRNILKINRHFHGILMSMR